MQYNTLGAYLKSFMIENQFPKFISDIFSKGFLKLISIVCHSTFIRGFPFNYNQFLRHSNWQLFSVQIIKPFNCISVDATVFLRTFSAISAAEQDMRPLVILGWHFPEFSHVISKRILSNLSTNKNNIKWFASSIKRYICFKRK